MPWRIPLPIWDCKTEVDPVLPFPRTFRGTNHGRPQWRGLTALQELRASGVGVASALDNVRDHWHPHGNHDMLTVWAVAL